jgi:hypothetical protein
MLGSVELPAPVPGTAVDEAVHAPTGGLMLLSSSVSAPFRANARPLRILAPVVMVILVSAITFPWSCEVEPRVAELPTCQKTEHPSAPLVSRTTEWLAVVSVLLILKMYTVEGLFP